MHVVALHAVALLAACPMVAMFMITAWDVSHRLHARSDEPAGLEAPAAQ